MGIESLLYGRESRRSIVIVVFLKEKHFGMKYIEEEEIDTQPLEQPRMVSSEVSKSVV